MKFEYLKLLVICFISVFNVSYSQKKIENDLSKSLLKGKVKQIKTISFEAVEKFGVLIKSSKTGTNIIEYNENGFIIKTTEYDEKNKITSTVKYKYDSKNNLIENPMFGGLSICKYDLNNFCIQKDEICPE